MFVIQRIFPKGELPTSPAATDAASLAIAAASGNLVEEKFLEWFDPEAYGGRGADGWTTDAAKAMKFESFERAMEFWRTQSKTAPLRPDGKPNRPLTAYSVTIKQLEVN